MNSKLKIAVGRMISCAPTKISSMSNSEEMMRWIPVIRLDKKELYIGLLADGRWVVVGKSGLHILQGSKSYFYLVAFLEEPFKKVREEVLQFFERFDTDIVDIDDSFPFAEITKAGFEFGTEYWAVLAFEWYSELPIEKKKLLRESLSKIVEQKMVNQKLRHNVMRELKRMV
jgi:hypothetical protein